MRDHEVKAVLRSSQGRQVIASAEKITRVPEQKHNRSLLSKAVHFAFGGGPQFTQQATAPGFGQTRVAKTAGIAAVNTARATIEDPGHVIPKTLGGAGQLAIGAIAAIPELAIETGRGAAAGDPLRGVKKMGSQAAKDFNRRYGALYRGDPGAAKAFRERIKKEGAAAELVDAATVLVPEGAIAGRTAGTAARAGKLGARAERIATEPRPALRISGEATRPQELSQNLIRATAQKGEDAFRRRQLAKRNADAAEKGKPIPGLQPRTRKVVTPARSVQVPSREAQVYDSRATQKALARHERRRLDKPFIREHEVADFQKGSKVQGVIYHVTNEQAAAKIRKTGVDPGKAQRGTFGLGTYSATIPETAAGKATVPVAVRLRKPLVATNENIEQVIGPFRQRAAEKVGIEDKRLLMAEMTKEIQRAGYDGVVIKGAVKGRGDYILNFHPQDVRVVADRNVARRGGRTSAVVARNLPAEKVTVPARTVRAGEVTAPTREVVAATKAGQRRLQRVEVSRIASRVYHGFKNEQSVEIERGAKRSLAGLNKHQRFAASTAIQGFVSTHDPVRAVAHLERRNAQIMAERAAETAERAKSNLGPRPIPTSIHGDELALNKYLIAHAKEIFNFKFAEFQKAEAARSIRVAAEQSDAHPVFKSSTAEVRRLRAQGNFLEVPYEYERTRHAIEDQFQSARRSAETDAGAAAAKQERDAALAALEERKPLIDAQYVAEVRAKAQKAGLPEPGFVSHHPRPDYGFSDFAPGGAKAIAGVRRSELTLHRLGIADTHPARYVQSLARTVKYKYNWPGVGAQAEAHSFNIRDLGTEQELRDILGRKGKVNENALTIEDLRRILAAKGLDPKDYAFWNPGRLRVAKETFQREGHADEHLDVGDGPEGAPGVHEGWNAAAIDKKGLDDLPTDQREIFMQSKGWKLLPREAYTEITDGTRPSGSFGRSVGKVQAFQSRVLLGLNPTWLQVQVAANAFLGGFGVALKKGTPVHAVEAIKWYNRQPADVKRTIDDALSTGVYQAHGEKVHLGAAADNDIVNWVRAVGELPAFQQAKRLNPMELIFKGDHAQNAYFRKVVLYSALKRDAFHDMGRGIGKTFDQQKKIAEILAIKDPEARMRAIVRDPQLFEKHAEYVNDVLGDYSRFTARERRYLKRGVLFYGFMRYSLRTLFYTLPVKHPLAAAVTAKLAQLHNDEVRDLLGGPDAPWAYSRVFFEGGDGKLRSIDFGRANPVTNPIINIAAEGKQALGGFVSPAIQTVTDQLYGKSLYSGQAFHVKGSAEDNPNPDAITSGRIVANDLLSTAFPYREAVKLTQGGTKQGDDTLLFSPRPIHYKTAQAQGRADERAAVQGSGGKQVLRDLAPLVVPKPDTSRDVVAGRRRKRGAPVGGGGGNRFGTSTPSRSGSSSGGNRFGT